MHLTELGTTHPEMSSSLQVVAEAELEHEHQSDPLLALWLIVEPRSYEDLRDVAAELYSAHSFPLADGRRNQIGWNQRSCRTSVSS